MSLIAYFPQTCPFPLHPPGCSSYPTVLYARFSILLAPFNIASQRVEADQRNFKTTSVSHECFAGRLWPTGHVFVTSELTNLLQNRKKTIALLGLNRACEWHHNFVNETTETDLKVFSDICFYAADKTSSQTLQLL